MLDEHYLSQFPALRGRLVRAAARMLGGPADAEDVVQESYLRALEAGEGPGPESMQAWLTTVMQHLAIDRLRRDGWMQRWLKDAEGLASEAPSAESEAAQAESIDQALRLVAAKLSPADGAAVLLREVFEASFREIAEAAGRTERPAGSSCIAHCCGCARKRAGMKPAPRTRSSMSTGRPCRTAMRACCSRCCGSRLRGPCRCRRARPVKHRAPSAR
ncbi:sigma-70 family RNA polymerase sigma factor [Variovorax atrisoli]|uniref:sigma-70 family RNA polymerase sigma factor n=1 Tax=Variovorax atrisoli TaxID=3394203 RepID=UPI001F0C072A|nr:sigma-70 family RNA polymerase sigma factor [Variovorax sp. 369]